MCSFVSEHIINMAGVWEGLKLTSVRPQGSCCSGWSNDIFCTRWWPTRTQSLTRSCFARLLSASASASAAAQPLPLCTAAVSLAARSKTCWVCVPTEGTQGSIGASSIAPHLPAVSLQTPGCLGGSLGNSWIAETRATGSPRIPIMTCGHLLPVSPTV